MELTTIKRALLSVLLASLGCGGGSKSAAPMKTNAPASATQASEDATDEAHAMPLDWSTLSSTSMRNPNDGRLVGGVPLPLTAPGLEFSRKRDPAARYGTVEVVRALVESANTVHEELGGLPVTINDLSYQSGGPIPRHRSHQSGRDVDVLFYQLGPNGQPIESVGAFFDPDGIGVDFRDLADPTDDVVLRLDVPRTWRFVRALIENEGANLQSIMVAEHIRTLLLEYAHAIDAPALAIERFEQMTCQPHYPHDDHFHFRFYCSLDDIAAGCRDSKPLYPWRTRALEEAGVEPLPLLPKRTAALAETVTHEEARKAAGPLDPEVERWLDRRKAWRDKPKPGRPYCR